MSLFEGDLYRKKEHEDGSASFEKLETPPSWEVRQLMADFEYIGSYKLRLECDLALLESLTERAISSGAKRCCR